MQNTELKGRSLLKVTGVIFIILSVLGLLASLVLIVAGLASGAEGGMAWGLLVAIMTLGVLAVHEAAHIACARVLGVPIGRLKLTPLGASLELDARLITPRNEALIAAAGPIASALCVAVLCLLTGGLDAEIQPAVFQPGDEHHGHILFTFYAKLWLHDSNSNSNGCV